MKPAAVALCLSLVAVVYGEDPAPSAPSAPSVAVCGSAPDGSRAGGAALAAVAALVLNATGVRAHVSRAVPACPAPSLGTVQLLAAGALDVALVAVNASSALSVLELRDTDLEELGDAAPAWRRACLATRPPARSLLDLADPALAEHYRLGPDDLRTISQFTCETKNCTFTPEWCKDPSSTCATILTSDESEKAVLARVVLEQELRARVVALGPALGEAAAALARPALLCDRAPDLSPLRRLQATALGPPPCRPYSDCPFEPLRLVKVVNAGALTQSTRALKTLAQLSFTAEELIDLTVRARIDGPEKAAQAYITQNLHLITPSPEVRVAVLLPLNTSRHAYEASDFEIAAKLVEKEIDGSLVRDRLFKIELKVEMHNDYCSAPFAYKILTNALGTGEYGSLSAVAGPACGAAFGDVARQALTHVMPLLAFTPQAPPPPEVAWLVLLAAGDARLHNDLWATLLAAMNWSRLAVLSEVATRASLDIARLNLTDASHLELPDDGNVHEELISKWVKRAAEGNFKILYPYLEDAREVRAALCAGHAAGLRPRDGAVWLLPAALPAGWASPDHLSCTAAHLDEMLEGHLRAVPAWEAEWPAAQRAAWAARCAGCVPRAALLYDALHMWAGALSRLLTADPFAHDNIHDPLKIRALIEDTISNEYVGLTGRFEWTLADGAHARSIPHVIQQWRNGTYEVVGRWDRGLLSLQPESLRWATDDGRIPDDGGEHCGLQPLAELLRADCRTAFIVLAALLLSALVGALAALALYCRRRAEREYRAHLEVLRMRTYGLKPGGLDRWEVPRERVVINRKLGTGAFGTVYGGHALLAEDRGWTAVAVKTLKAGATTEEKLDFLSEAEAMKRFDHKNVVRLLAVVTKTEPVCTVMEFMLYGDLKNYLLARRHLATESGISAGSDEAAEEVSPRRLTGMALDAARALSYLAQLRYVHRDVAARNCLVSANRVVKLADFGMTRLVFENDYYRFSRKGMLPVRWMAPESLALGVFSPASDVWSFGVLLYEIVTFGSLPFQGLSNSEVLGRVKAGHTLELPKGLKPQLEGLIKSCWQQEAKARPAAAAVAAFLADSPRLLAPCLDVPLDALPLDPDPPWRAARDRAEARWVSWAAPASAATDTTYLSADARPPSEHDAFLPLPPTP